MKSFAFALVLSIALPALADIVHLNDGRTIEGTIKRSREGYIVSDAAGTATIVPFDAVKSIELKKTPGPQSAEDSLASLRRTAANIDDPKQIIARYKSFLVQNAGNPAAKEAEQDLTQWQDRLDKRMVKAGHEWVTPDQLAVLQAKARQAAAKAVPLVAAGKLTEASAIIDPALTVAPTSGELLYLKGLLLYRESQWVAARNAFQGAVAQQPDNAAAHNNIAVILWKTRSQMPALLEFDKAMIALPNNQTILDNVAEALHALPGESHKNELSKRVVEHFNSQDSVLQRQMAQRGLYRWGSQWLDQQQYASIQQQQKAVQDKLNSLESQFNANQQRMIQIAQTIDSDQQIMNAMQQQQAVVKDANGNIILLPLPQRFYDLQNDQQQLSIERDTVQRQQIELRRLASEQQKNLPQATYSGVLKIFDVEGVPSLSAAPATPATAPATAPAASATTKPANRTGGADY
jgi:Flp pilus assembly protein TadD